MNKQGIKKVFTEQIKEYIDNGYVIADVGTNAYHKQNGVYLNKGNSNVLIYTYKDTYYEGIFVEETKWVSGHEVKTMNFFKKFWTFNHTYFFEDEEEFLKGVEIHKSREEYNYTKDYIRVPLKSDEAKRIALKFINRMPKCKSKKLKDIDNIYHSISYGKYSSYKVHLTNFKLFTLY